MTRLSYPSFHSFDVREIGVNILVGERTFALVFIWYPANLELMAGSLLRFIFSFYCCQSWALPGLFSRCSDVAGCWWHGQSDLTGVFGRNWGGGWRCRDEVSSVCSISLHRQWSQYFGSVGTNGHPNHLKSDWCTLNGTLSFIKWLRDNPALGGCTRGPGLNEWWPGWYMHRVISISTDYVASFIPLITVCLVIPQRGKRCLSSTWYQQNVWCAMTLFSIVMTCGKYANIQMWLLTIQFLCLSENDSIRCSTYTRPVVAL